MANPNIVARASSKAVSALPKFVIENYDRFVNFLRDYYTWSASQGPDLALESLKLANDIDLVVAEMLPSYQASYAKNFPTEMKTNFRHFAKFLKEFYQLRGTEESYKIFFRAVFNEEASVYFPKVQIFKPSEAIWNKDTYFKASAVSGNPFDLINLEVTGSTNGYTAIISNVVKVGDKYDVYFEDATGVFEKGEIITANGISVSVVPLFAVKSFVSNPSWFDSSLIHTNEIIVKVDKIHYGRIVDITIANGGSGYAVDDVITASSAYFGSGFSAKVTNVDGSGAITGFLIERSGFGFSHDDVQLAVASLSGVGASLSPVFNTEFMRIQSLSIIQNTEYTTVGDLVVNLPDGTQITFTEGLTQTNRYWTKSQSALSSGFAKLHDSSYYQEFSYEIQTRANAKEQEYALKALLHIAGLKMFLKTVIQEDVGLQTEFTV